MDVSIAILTGVTVFVAGQIIIKLLIDPVHAMKTVVADIAHCLVLRANVYSNPRPQGDEEHKLILEEFRVLSSKLHSAMNFVPLYFISSKLFGLPNRSNVTKASQNLIALYNGSDNDLKNQGILNAYAAQHIREELDIYIPEGERLDNELEREFISAKDT